MSSNMPSNITDVAAQIRTDVYGKDMRTHIADGFDLVNNVTINTAQTVATAAQDAKNAKNAAVDAKNAAVKAQREASDSAAAAEQSSSDAASAYRKATDSATSASISAGKATEAAESAKAVQLSAASVQRAVEETKTQAITAITQSKDAAVQARDEATTAKNEAVTAKNEAVTAKDAAVQAQIAASNSASAAVVAQGNAEQAQRAAEAAIVALDEISPSVSAKYTSLFDIPSNRYTTMMSEQIIGIEPNFPFELRPKTRYVIKTATYAQSYRSFIISSANGSEVYYGYTSRTSPNDIIWTDLSYLDIREISPSVSATYESLFDIPVNRYTTMMGEQIIGGEGVTAIEPNFPFEIRPKSRYVIKTATYAKSYRSFIISSVNGSEVYYGYTSRTSPNDIIWSNPQSSSLDSSFEILHKQETGDVQVYTEFELLDGWYKKDGSCVSSNGVTHTAPFAVLPGATYYTTKTSYLRGTSWAEGAFFDKDKKQIGVLLASDYEDYAYKTANSEPGSALTDYVPLCKFTIPNNAYYFSYNHIRNIYNEYFSNVPVYCHINTGNLILRDTDAACQYFRKRKLCVIGPSTVMIDRLKRTGNFNNDGTNQTEYVVGFQEYLIPFWQKVDSYGYSGASYAKYDVEDGSAHRSIYSRIVTDNLDLSGYDDYLIISNGNYATTKPVGSVNSYSDLGDSSTYIGALRRIIEHIYSGTPQAKIYLTTMRRYGAQYASSEAWSRFDQINTETVKLASMLGIQVIDFTQTGFNHFTDTRWSYDATAPSVGGHWNHIGSREIGLFIRRAIVGV